jgi:uncharacterized protein (DUF2236 family)
MIGTRTSGKVEPHEDNGFFGPGSVTWKVWAYPTSLTVGFIRAVVVEELDPALIAAVDNTRDIYKRPKTRFDRTLRYFALVAFGDTRTTSQVADMLVKIHSKAIGTDPYSGKAYDANDPQSQLWIHMTAWHSILYAYESYGPGRLSEEDEAQYWAECAVAAELQTCSPDDVPRTREGVRAYFEQMRPQLSGSPIAREAMNHLLNGGSLVSPLRGPLMPATWLINASLRAGVIATLPIWMREMGGPPGSADRLLGHPPEQARRTAGPWHDLAGDRASRQADSSQGSGAQRRGADADRGPRTVRI